MVRPASRWAPRPHSGVAGFPWNQWQLCYGISGNFRVEQVAALAWNRWQDSPGISGSFGVEYARDQGGEVVKMQGLLTQELTEGLALSQAKGLEPQMEADLLLVCRDRGLALSIGLNHRGGQG